MKQLNETIRLLFKLTEEQAAVFLSAFTKTELRKKNIFVEAGQVCNKVGLITKGLMKCAYNKNGEEIIHDFAFENQFVSDYYSFTTLTPSVKQITCLEDTEVYIITRERLEQLGRKHAFIESMSNKINEQLFLRTHERLKSFLLDTAAERYQALLSQRTDLAERIPQYLIASYLRVTPETISRIRKKISRTYPS